MNAPALSRAVDFVSGMLPGMPENKTQQRGYILNEVLKHLEETWQDLQRGQINYDPDEYDDSI